jgi:hypothetical protein
MEHVMNARVGRKLQTIGDWSQSLDHLIGAEVLGRQLGQGTVAN